MYILSSPLCLLQQMRQVGVKNEGSAHSTFLRASAMQGRRVFPTIGLRSFQLILHDHPHARRCLGALSVR